MSYAAVVFHGEEGPTLPPAAGSSPRRPLRLFGDGGAGGGRGRPRARRGQRARPTRWFSP
ncbi:hypothetical protein SLNWT_0212 [Streptomyces albus]|uniref:Uncharacterized protein n=1 Tax=Streptomyces albus (strain ATCC 21838 / DSM 41398 / FERM P-419 / JCM 4703 / NBRC 107858) TaxID=1081613 RepID=A0A0B5EF18_STRA4|nr:hypothetical protein SLNWT_0212 [Streptomyces albus]